MKDCTFKPETKESKESIRLKVDYSKMNSQAIQKFLDRQNEARLRREKSEEKIKKLPGSGNIWKNKVTKPISPEISENFTQ